MRLCSTSSVVWLRIDIVMIKDEGTLSRLRTTGLVVVYLGTAALTIPYVSRS